MNTLAVFSFKEILIQANIERIGVTVNESVTYDMEAAKQAKQYNFTIAKFAEELTFRITNSDKE